MPRDRHAALPRPFPLLRERVRRASFRRTLASAADRGGAALLQFALILPVFVALLFGIIEIGRGLWLQNALHYAVEQAARCASVNTTTCSAANIGSYAASISGANFPSTAFSLDSSQGCGNQVTGSYTMALHIPYYRMSWTLTAQSCFPK